MQGCNVNHIPRLLVQSCEVKCFSGGHITIASVPAETRVGFIYEQAWDHKEEGETKASNAFIKPSSFLLCKVMCVCVCVFAKSWGTFYVHGRKYEWLGLCVYSSISAGALSYKIVPIMAVVEINKLFIDRPGFQFPPLTSGAMPKPREESLLTPVPTVRTQTDRQITRRTR